MSNNVFGEPVTNSIVLEVLLDVTNITPRHRAEAALIYINADSKSQLVRKFVSDLYWSYGKQPMTLCTIYNATGGNLTFVRNHSWSGDVWSSPYPHIILNGQWAAFLHVRSRNRSKEAVVYRGSNLDGRPREWVLAWDTVSEFPLQNRVYTEVRETTATINWNTVSSNIDRNLANHVVSSLGCFSSVAIGSTAAPHFTGIMSLDGVTNRDSMASDAISAILPVSLDSDHIGDDETTTPATPAAAPAAE